MTISASLHLANLDLAAGRLKQAEKRYEKLLDGPEAMYAWTGIGAVRMRFAARGEGDIEQAVQCFRIACDGSSKRVRAEIELLFAQHALSLCRDIVSRVSELSRELEDAENEVETGIVTGILSCFVGGRSHAGRFAQLLGVAGVRRGVRGVDKAVARGQRVIAEYQRLRQFTVKLMTAVRYFSTTDDPRYAELREAAAELLASLEVKKIT